MTTRRLDLFFCTLSLIFEIYKLRAIELSPYDRDIIINPTIIASVPAILFIPMLSFKTMLDRASTSM